MVSKKAVLLVENLEPHVDRRDGFRGAEKERSSGSQGKREDIQRPALGVWIEIDEQVAAGDKVHARKRRVLEQIVGGEEDQFPQLPAHAIAALVAKEKGAQAFF